jgi:hypothetical protein
MSDGRHFTDYKPRCIANIALANGGAINSYDVRQFLVHNADNIMLKNRTEARDANLCGPCVEPWNQGTMLQEQTQVKCNESTCQTATTDPYGHGQGRDYGSEQDYDFIKQRTNENESMRKNKANICTTEQDDIAYYPINGVDANLIERHSIPSGGNPFERKW